MNTDKSKYLTDEDSIVKAHPNNKQIIMDAYGYYFKEIGEYVDCMGYISKKAMCDIMDEEYSDEPWDDLWILDLEDWDYEIHFGVEKFRPTILRGKVSRELNEQYNK